MLLWSQRNSHLPSRHRLAFAGIVALVAMLATPKADAADRDLVVMTQNLYLGSSLEGMLEATTLDEFVEATARVFATVQYTQYSDVFAARLEEIADEIQAKGPDIIGLQEVVTWTTEGLNAPTGYDFLALLQSALASRGLNYSVAAELEYGPLGPVPLVISMAECPVLMGPKYSCAVTLTDRDVILVNDDTPGLTWSNPDKGLYTTLATVGLAVGDFTFERGWTSIDVELNDCSFRFVNTHLESADYPDVQLAQANELLAGPASGERVIAVGDFESAADGSTTESYASLTALGALVDAWDESVLGPGWTCCQRSNTPPFAKNALNNPVSTLDIRSDLILTRGLASLGAELIGDAPFQAEPPFWPSDHAGVVATIACASSVPTLRWYVLGLLAVLLLGAGYVGLRRLA